ncbi:branched-chain amino acid ABC transporter permease [Pseudarthrobacter sulfonivorans]|uniref:branched-chain amino acid ABC transporter permease n=1 Tax=Pseudarthrobacter sulfonivorans TaxID=121292 RepID=UPI00168B4813|nr:branched-chain amino acid ABC transporter permease [Pseudarthrobacter sulfonivorans]
MTIVETALLTGLVLGSIYILVGVGYNIVLITSGAFNFAQAAKVMLATFLAYQFGVVAELPTPLVMVFGALIGAAVGLATELVAIRPVAGKGLHGELVTTVGVSTIITGIVVTIWGTNVRPVNAFVSAEVITVLGGRITVDALILVIVAVVVCASVWAWSRFTLSGLAALAISEDRVAATLRGINVNRLSILAMAGAGAIAGAIGPIVGTQTLAVSTIGAVVTLKAFLVLIVGGMGSFPGLLVGGLVIGPIESLTVRYFGSEFSTPVLFAVLLIVLLVKPEGLFGQKIERTV